jgi:hypothetical protein
MSSSLTEEITVPGRPEVQEVPDGIYALLAALDVHPRVAMGILRHSRIALTMEIYTQVRELAWSPPACPSPFTWREKSFVPVLTEFVRVLRPGGHLVISDSRGQLGYFGSPVVKALPGSGFGYLPHRNRLTSDYLAAALPLGLQVRRCEEPRRPYPLIDPDAPPDTILRDEPPDMWSLHSWCPAATNAAYRDNPAAIVWHFQLPAAGSFPDHRAGG